MRWNGKLGKLGMFSRLVKLSEFVLSKEVINFQDHWKVALEPEKIVVAISKLNMYCLAQLLNSLG